MTELLLVRHGETDYNRDKKFLGLTDIGLNSDGREQILNLSEKVIEENINYIISSDLLRCRETVEILNLPLEVSFTKNLREMNFGLWEGLTWNEIEVKFKAESENWKEDWTNTRAPEGENFIEAGNRIIPEIEKLITGPHEKILVVTHGGCIRAILGHFLLDSMEKSWRFHIENGAMSRLCINRNFIYLKTLNEQ